MDGYILKGVNDEYLLVIKSDNIETILHLIDKISTSTKDEIKDLASKLEKSLYDDGSRRNSGKAGPKNKTKSANSGSSRRTKATDTKHRTKPST